MADSNIEQLLKQILGTKLGKDMRQAIHDGIEQCYEDGKVGAVDLVARQRIDNLSKLEPGSTTGDAELRDIRIGYDGTKYETAGEAVRGQMDSLSEEIDTLNQGGLNLKEDFIGQQVNEWLNEHPEATTTVQNGSIDEVKFSDSLRKKKANYYNSVVEMKSDMSLKEGTTSVTLGYYEPNDGGGCTYRIRTKLETDADDGGSIHELSNGNIAELIVEEYVTPESFGAIGDGVTNDTEPLLKMIQFLQKNDSVLFGRNKVYEISQEIVVDKEINIDLNNSTIKSIGNQENVISYSLISPEKISAIKNGCIDGNNKSNCIKNSKKSVYIENLTFMNPLSIGLDVSDGYETVVNNCYFRNEFNNEATAVKTRADNLFSNIIFRGFKKCLYTIGTSRFVNIHAWIDSVEKVKGSIFCDNAKGFFANCFCDTYEIGFRKTSNAFLGISNLHYYYNTIFYNNESTDTEPYIFWYENPESSGYTTAQNVYFIIPSIESSGLDGYIFESNLDSKENYSDVSIYGNTDTIKNKSFNYVYELDLTLKPGVTGAAKASINKKECNIYFSLTITDTSSYIELFDLPEEIQPINPIVFGVFERSNTDSMESTYMYIGKQSPAYTVTVKRVNSSNNKYVGNISYRIK